ncbi:hypothetical protein VSH64_36050 [Amycolatopsis rhabdoformis]|uniref:ABM domain-containing protein n=1 Tax=Amycolatopsis rhabdoformis TaxID=1448059 RepID=A0ABZ1I1G3_9PSEU|nr:hypothetical protein [Amycolatopsis rhabdoformis]WSE28214.1 hypothetical protein VSH64_36050 [Amycolatopsis rhabdoformis]
MPTLMTMQMTGNAAQLEKTAATEPESMRAIVDAARARGLISHHFWAEGDTILIVDIWPDQAAFEAFFADQGERIRSVMSAAGVTSPPEVRFFRQLSIGDDVD